MGRLFDRAGKNCEKRAAFLIAQARTVKNSPPFSPRSPERCKTARLFRRAVRNGAKQPAFFTAQGGGYANGGAFGTLQPSLYAAVGPL